MDPTSLPMRQRARLMLKRRHSADDEVTRMALIASYGELWSRHAIDWGIRGPGGKGTLLGEWDPKSNPVQVDVWDQEGIYVLHADHQVVYVGLAHGTRLGPRLRGHRDDHLAGRWDQFSWYGTRAVLRGGSLGVSAATKNVGTLEALHIIEALMIRAAPGALNKAIGALKGATRVRQVGHETRPTSQVLHELIKTGADIQARLTAIERHLSNGAAPHGP